jgi:hypothetical protein
LLATRVLETVYRAQRAAGDNWIPLSPASVADVLNSAPQQAGANAITPDMVRDLIAALSKLGALDQRGAFSPGLQPQFKVPV